MQREKQMSDRFLTAAMLAVVGGFLDAYTYICRGKVFANAQTGNMVLFGIRLAEENFLGSFLYCIPILAFVVGIFAAELVRRVWRQHRFHWRQAVLLLEIAITLAVSFFPSSKGWNTAANILISLVCALQVQAFRKIHENTMATTMCTGNLRSAAVCFSDYFAGHKKEDLRNGCIYLGVIFFFIGGAVAGSVLTKQFSVHALLFASLLLVLVFLLLFVNNRKCR